MAANLMQVHGSCHCGAITYEAIVDPERVTICHCTDCQSLTGSAYRVSVPANVEDFRLSTGAPRVYLKVGHRMRREHQPGCHQLLHWADRQKHASHAFVCRSSNVRRMNAQSRQLPMRHSTAYEQEASSLLVTHLTGLAGLSYEKACTLPKMKSEKLSVGGRKSWFVVYRHDLSVREILVVVRVERQGVMGMFTKPIERGVVIHRNGEMRPATEVELVETLA